jgi:hypothetical protein
MKRIFLIIAILIISNYAFSNSENNQKIIFHHTKGSPYAEKIRTILSYLNLDWYAVEASCSTPDREDQKNLVQAYSTRIPILQIGSDVYCDTRVIALKLIQLAGDTTLLKPEIEEFIDSVEINSDYYLASLNSISTYNTIMGYWEH